MDVRDGFTQLELIVVIVIIGILSYAAIPKLSANRDDANLALEVSRMGVCLEESSVYYLVHNTHVPVGYSSSCDDLICYNRTTNGASLIVTIDADRENYCADIDEIGGHLAKTYNF